MDFGSFWTQLAVFSVPYLLLFAVGILAKIYQLTRKTFDHEKLGLITLQGDIWAGLLPYDEHAVRFELRGSNETDQPVMTETSISKNTRFLSPDPRMSSGIHNIAERISQHPGNTLLA